MSAAAALVPMLSTVSQIDGSRDDGDRRRDNRCSQGEGETVMSVTDEALSANASVDKEKGS
jgi:hypothetical protein